MLSKHNFIFLESKENIIKTKASEIESSVFMSTILIHRNLIRDNYEIYDIKNQTVSTNFVSRDSKIFTESE